MNGRPFVVLPREKKKRGLVWLRKEDEKVAKKKKKEWK